jgi:hypothetical protein
MRGKTTLREGVAFPRSDAVGRPKIAVTPQANHGLSTRRLMNFARRDKKQKHRSRQISLPTKFFWPGFSSYRFDERRAFGRHVLSRTQTQRLRG